VDFPIIQLQLKFVTVINGLSKFAMEYLDFFQHIECDQWLDEDFDFNNKKVEVQSEKIQELQERSQELQMDQDIFIESLLKSNSTLKSLSKEPVSISTNQMKMTEIIHQKSKKKKFEDAVNVSSKKQSSSFKFPKAANYSSAKEVSLIEDYHKKKAFQCVECTELDSKENMLKDTKLLCGWCCINCFKNKFNETLTGHFEFCADCRMVIFEPKIAQNCFFDEKDYFCFECQFKE
jgi:hypothetical protein